MAAKLFDLYNNTNLLYLTFLKPIPTQLEKLNKNFQSQNADPTKLLNDMEISINFLKQFVLDPTTDVDVFTEEVESFINNNCYLGFSFETTLKEFKNQIDSDTENCIRRNCVQFVVYLINQLKKGT